MSFPARPRSLRVAFDVEGFGDNCLSSRPNRHSSLIVTPFNNLLLIQSVLLPFFDCMHQH